MPLIRFIVEGVFFAYGNLNHLYESYFKQTLSDYSRDFNSIYPKYK